MGCPPFYTLQTSPRFVFHLGIQPQKLLGQSKWKCPYLHKCSALDASSSSPSTWIHSPAQPPFGRGQLRPPLQYAEPSSSRTLNRQLLANISLHACEKRRARRVREEGRCKVFRFQKDGTLLPLMWKTPMAKRRDERDVVRF
jgi:hypothetical protein